VEAGLYLNPQTTHASHDAAIIEATLGHVRLADQLGFSAVWITEHCFSGYNAYSDPLVLGAHVAGLAPRMHVGFSVAVAALHHPIRFAIQAALLDNLTKGRFIPAIGTGMGPADFGAFGIGLADRKDAVDAWVEIVQRAWQHQGPEPYVFKTPWWSGKLDGRIIPAPVQQPHPPIARATLTPSRARELGRQGRPMLMTLSGGTGPTLWNAFIEGIEEGGLSEAERDRALRWTGFAQHVRISDGPDPAGEIWEYAKVYLSKGVRAHFGYDEASPPDWELRKRLYREHTLLAGSPQAIIDKLGPWAERGMRHTMVWPYFGEMPPALAAETIQRFAEEVLPVLRRIAPARLSPAPLARGALAHPMAEGR
jgi:alkanesulfonate monooxygenase SsuD/methylene tetrahydromethanopterin reductase-like flavin-dependent oxidoreductase (luciferase family)